MIGLCSNGITVSGAAWWAVCQRCPPPFREGAKKARQLLATVGLSQLLYDFGAHHCSYRTASRPVPLAIEIAPADISHVLPKAKRSAYQQQSSQAANLRSNQSRQPNENLEASAAAARTEQKQNMKAGNNVGNIKFPTLPQINMRSILSFKTQVVRVEGLEPPRLAAQEPKSKEYI